MRFSSEQAQSEASTMRELLTVVTRKGQVTVPAEVRRALELKQGDKVAFVLPETKSDVVSMRRVGSVVEQTFGSLSSPIPALSPQEERRAFEEGVAQEVEAETPLPRQQ
jgi:AbrB family looped-hinge helix DNA binding protein